MIELLSPTNKRKGTDGRQQYNEKSAALLKTKAHFVELDLLRCGQRTHVSDPPLGDYFALVSKADRRPLVDVYGWPLLHRLPIIPIPLAGDDPDVPLDLQAVFTLVYDRAGYDYALDACFHLEWDNCSTRMLHSVANRGRLSSESVHGMLRIRFGKPPNDLSCHTTLSNPMNETEISSFVSQLASHDESIRKNARQSLVKAGGHDVTRSLVAELVDPRQQVRWEAAKALVAIADPIAAPGLLHALEDEDSDVRWVAAEGLIALGPAGLHTVLSGLTRRARSPEFCESAHHVLHQLKQKSDADAIAPVLNALDSSEPEVAAAIAAYEALVALKQGA